MLSGPGGMTPRSSPLSAQPALSRGPQVLLTGRWQGQARPLGADKLKAHSASLGHPQGQGPCSVWL